ncbi:diguanylate cyclase (GGDEF) domain-containing protein [Geodermatophilus telluris]|uniref:Diguanylate cyclase (GGDEF) domain-containing protein n=1 Tax=Geodermatophilus telluris TaxID=1190417 RepID=A0A1G6Q7J8_9ACTN|nr:GGDEF domain-containing protein [Geodermatophilus telluris]SDC88450.1 diguanylate cyclase (GGDEF) domain-containing protein [Geodermatophilus telluris]
MTRRRRLPAWLVTGLLRPLAGDDERVEYWVRHVRTGVLLTQLCGWTTLAHLFFAPSSPQVDLGLLALAGGVVLLSPLLLALPLRQMMRDLRGCLLFYGWSLATTIVVALGARLDGGTSSPFWTMLFVTLAFMAVAYPPVGVALTGAGMALAHLFVVADEIDSHVVFTASVMAVFTICCSFTSANHWAAQDRQVLLLRAQEALATTDPLTGVPNRRAFLERLERAVGRAGAGERAVVCIVDLDGFKAVNDLEGHAAGDAVLRAVAEALTAAVRETDTVARLGGDEFAVLADALLPADDAVLADRLRAAVAAVGAGHGVTASVGRALVGAGDDVAGVLHRADAAMYRAKAAGGDGVHELAG